MKHFYLLVLATLLVTCQSSGTYENALTHFPAFDVQGHRGARGLSPENTIPSLIKALELGVTTLEFDVVVSADKLVILSHEPWFHHAISTKPDGTPVNSMEEMLFNLYHFSYDDIKTFDVGRRGHPEFPFQQVLRVHKPSLKEAITAILQWEAQHKPDHVVHFNIEMKSMPEWIQSYVPDPQVFAELLYNELRDLNILHRTLIQSFHHDALNAMSALDANLPLVLLVQDERPMEEHLSRLNHTPAVYSPYFKLVTKELVQEGYERGMKVIPWTVNDPEDMRNLISLGVHGIITDYPDRFDWTWVK